MRGGHLMANASVIDYLELVSNASDLADEATGVVDAITRVEHFLPTMLKLPSHLAERAASPSTARPRPLM